MAGSAFINREVFDECLQPRYEDRQTIYGDLSRLVVAWAATTDPAELATTYTELGWKGSPNVRAIHDAAKAWMAKHRPQGAGD